MMVKCTIKQKNTKWTFVLNIIIKSVLFSILQFLEFSTLQFLDAYLFLVILDQKKSKYRVDIKIAIPTPS